MTSLIFRMGAALQNDLEPEAFNRSGAEIVQSLAGKGFDLYEEAMRRLAQKSPDEPLNLMEAGCGTGRAIHDITCELRRRAAEAGFTNPIRGIGFDINPRVDLYPRKSGPALILIMDAQRMEWIKHDSVDIAWGYNILRYLDDKLAALEEGWKRLRPPDKEREGGVMVWTNVGAWTMTHPPFPRILESTQGGAETFSIRDEEGNLPFYYCRRVTGAFRGFPYALSGAHNPYDLMDASILSPEQKYDRLSFYERTR